MRLRQAMKILKNRARRPCRDHTWWKAYRRVLNWTGRTGQVRFGWWWDPRTRRLSYERGGAQPHEEPTRKECST